MYIMTAEGWKKLEPKFFVPAQLTPTLLQRMGIKETFMDMDVYCQAARDYRAGKITLEAMYRIQRYA